MPITVVVGGQFGSEGKGKIALALARELGASASVRVGGPNSGHTVIDRFGNARVFRQLPTAALLPKGECVVAPGSYVDAEILLAEVTLARLAPERVSIDPNAVLITSDDKAEERELGLRERIGSTQSGTGAAVRRRIVRANGMRFAKDDDRLRPFVRPTSPLLRNLLDRGARIIIEGTQGFGLSAIHGDCHPYATSRDTTASGFLSEVGLSPIDVDDIVLVLRAFPIRVSGKSGPLPREIDWKTVEIESGSAHPIIEHTSATRRVRRVARFDADVVTRAIRANQPTRIVLNHVDYIDANHRNGASDLVRRFVAEVSLSINRRIDLLGFSPATLLPAESCAETLRGEVSI